MDFLKFEVKWDNFTCVQLGKLSRKYSCVNEFWFKKFKKYTSALLFSHILNLFSGFVSPQESEVVNEIWDKISEVV